MGPKTIKRLAILISVVLVTGLAIFFIQRYQVTRMAQLVLDDAEKAERDGNFDEAARIYQERLIAIPDDVDTKLKLADVLRKGTPTPQRLDQAARVYAEILSRKPGWMEVHRRLAELAFELERYNPPPNVTSTTEFARPHLELLLKVEPDGKLPDPKVLTEPPDGGLCFLLGCCQEAAGDYVNAADAYRVAIANHAPQQIEASRRLATLLRIPGKQQDLVAAKRVIDKMVSADPNNYQVYLERGRYLYQPPSTPENQKAASADFQRALKLAPGDPQVYRELAALELNAKPPNFEAARGFLSSGLAVAPKDPSLHLAVASLERRAGSIDKAITSLRKSLEVLPDDVNLHLMLVNQLVDQGNTTDLLLQIEDLKRLNISPVIVDFFGACYQVNSSEWTKARQSLVRLEAMAIFESRPELKSKVNLLLARCYNHLNDKERQHDALVEATRANPRDVEARLGLATSLAARGEIDQAIAEYEKLDTRAPQICGRLVELLIVRNQQRPAEERNWKKIEELINQATSSAPMSAESHLMRTEMLVAQGKLTEAQTLLDQARQRFPKEVAFWSSCIDLLRRQGKLDQAQSLLDQAEKTLGDSADLELAHARLLFAKGGTDLPKTLGELAQKSRAFASSDRRRLIEVLAPGAARLGDLTLANTLWSEVVALDPNDLGPRLQLLGLAFQAGNEADIKRIIADIKQIDGIDGLTGRYQEIYYLIWQAQKSTDQNAKQTLRNAARLQLSELSSRRPNWSLIPLALAEIGEQELRDLQQEKQDLALSNAKTRNPQTQPRTLKEIEDDEKSKEDETANLYLQAIDLGQRSLTIVRRATDLLYHLKRDTEVSQVWSQLPASGIVGGTLQNQEAFAAFRNQDFKLALDLASKSVEAHPNDFRERLFLAWILNAKGGDGPAQAVDVLRKGISLAPTDPDRWLNLVLFLVQTGQVDKAEIAVSEAKAALPGNQAPTLLSLAQCGAAIGTSYHKTGNSQKAAKWDGDATAWYEKAHEAKPDDPSITRELTQFLFRRGEIGKVKAQLASILKQPPGPANADELAWARRMLALTLLASNDYEQALKVVEPIAHALTEQGPEGKPTQEPEDLRVLARVYESQNTLLYKKKALETLEKLVAAGNLASPDDRFRLAQLYHQNGNWTKAREQFRALIAQTENRHDFEALTRRPEYIAQYIAALLKQFRAGQDQEALTEAQELIGKLKVDRPDNVVVVALEAQILKAQKQTDKAVELIETTAAVPKQTNDARLALARLAEELGELGLAERLFRQLALQADHKNRLALAQFLSRQGRVKDALDLCEPVWKESDDLEKDKLVNVLLETLLVEKSKADATQVERIADWMQTALDRVGPRTKSSILRVGLANLRERQKKFEAAKALYSQDIEQGGGDVVSLNNLAWLTILKDAKESGSALSLIKRAIDRRGPLPELLDTRGVIYLKAGDFRRAIADLTTAAAGAPTPAKYFHLAQAYLGAKNKEAATQNWDKALKIGLKEESLHPLEVGTYKEVLSALEVR
jgi:tetratricopeptide (TPR) repeat protein